MDGGYINEGGQMKNINGQKYVINHRRYDGYYVSKACAIMWLLLALAAMLSIFLLTYFLLIPSCALSNEQAEQPNQTVLSSSILGDRIFQKDDPVAAIQNGHSNTDLDYPDDQTLKTDVKIDDTTDLIKLYDGWNPIHYDLIIEPDLVSGATNGTVTVALTRDDQIHGLQPIVFDISDIQIVQTAVFSKSTSKEVPFEATYGPNNQTFVIVVKRTPKDEVANLKVSMDFHGKLSSTMQGIYRGEYKDTENADTQAYVSTQFSPIDARKAFPCMDRPDKKANFTISIIRPLTMNTVLSNMRLVSSTMHRLGFSMEKFETTPKMPTYLVAFHISNLHRSTVSDNDPFLPEVNIYSRKEVSEMTRYSHEFTRKVWQYLQQYFTAELTLNKIDLIAVPDFGFNAMENTGMITFKEAALIVPEMNSKSSSSDHKIEVTKVLAHELTHQWFGNSVTMKWWNDLWLKEGFATYFSYKCLNDIVPQWGLMDFFPITEQKDAMDSDSDKLAHPISFDVNRASDIRRIFDPISYSKGASVIRMVNAFLGEEAFQQGIVNYLHEYQYSNAAEADLWRLLSQSGHKYETLPAELNLAVVMDSYTKQPGYPVLEVNVDEASGEIILSQQRYLLPSKNSNDSSKWYIPVTYRTKLNSAIQTVWFAPSEGSIRLPRIDMDEWIHMNINRTGYYRVNYATKLWGKFVYGFGELDQLTRAQLVDDAFALSRAEFVEYDVPLSFLLVIGHKPDPYSWAAAEPGLKYITQMVRREPAYEPLRTLMLAIFKRMFDDLKFKEQANETDLQMVHRARMLKLICEFKLDRCTHAAQMMFREWITTKNNSIPPNLKMVVYCTSIREGGVTEWSYAFKKYLETTNVNEKQIILGALGCTTETFLLSKYLNLTINPDSGIRKQDAQLAFDSVAKNYMGYETAFDFLYSNIKEISEYFGDGFQTLSTMIDSVTTYMNRDYHQQQFERFAKKARHLGLHSIEKSIHLAEETIRNNIFWRSRSYYKFQTYLEKLIKDLSIPY